jgi:hypothetical protein
MQVDGGNVGSGAKSDNDENIELDDLIAQGGNSYSNLANKKILFTNT